MNKIQKIEVFIDPATIPSINYFLHFAENYQDFDTIRIFGLQRYSIPEDIKKSFSEEKLISCNITCNEHGDLHNHFFAIIDKFSNIDLTFHLNLSYSTSDLIPMLLFCFIFKHKFLSIKLEIYDEGSLGAYELYNISNMDLDINGIVKSEIDKLNRIPEQLSFSAENRIITNYLWGTFLPTTYHFLDSRYLENTSCLRPIYQSISSYKKIDFSRYHKLDKFQKDFFLSLFGLAKEDLIYLEKYFSHHRSFLFVGTVIFDMSQKQLMLDAHIKLIDEYVSPGGKYYVGEEITFLYKSHPAATWMEDIIKFIYPNVVFIPSSIPIELIFMMGYFPDKIGGFASSSYFSIPKERIHDVVFMTNENDSLDDDYHHEQYKLRNIFIELGVIPEENAHYYYNS